MIRRHFLKATAATFAGASLPNASRAEPSSDRRFKLDYAPHFGMFRHSAGPDLIDQLRFAADEGFRAWEDNGMKGRSVEDQSRIAAEMERLDLRMGVFVAHASFGKVTFAGSDPAVRDAVVDEIRASVEVAKRVNAKWMTVVPGDYDRGSEWGFQTANCIDLLRRCCDVLEPHGLVMVLEPLNWWTNHEGLFLHKIPQAYEICRGVNRPQCKILFDLYHQQIQEGNLIPNLDRAWSEVAYLQVGDNPGRKEPGTGEINYRNIFGYAHRRGFEGIVGMEHGASQGGKKGERAVIDAYVAADAF